MARSLAVAGVRPLMERHGLPRYGQSAWLADALGLSYSQAHRRMTGAFAWALEDLAKGRVPLRGEPRGRRRRNANRRGSAGHDSTSARRRCRVGPGWDTRCCAWPCRPQFPRL